MKTIERFVSLLLTVLMLISLFCVSASAVTTYVEDFGFSLDNETMQATIVEYIGNDSVLEFPTKVYDYTVTAISNSVFSGNNTLEQITISSTIESIGDNAFTGCTQLKSIVIPSSVNTIGKAVFQNCSSLQTVELLANVDTIPQSTFYNCKALNTVIKS